MTEHPDRPEAPLDLDRLGSGAVGAEHDRANPARLAGRDEHDRTGAVGEHGGGPSVGRVRDPRHQVGADHDDATTAARIDHRGAGRQRRNESRARRADVEGAGAGCADQAGDDGSGVRHDVVSGRGRDEHEVDIERVDAGSPERVERRGRCVLLQPLVRLGDPPGANSGTTLDPIGREPEPALDLRRADDRARQVHPDRGHGGAPETGHRALLGNRGPNRDGHARQSLLAFRTRSRPPGGQTTRAGGGQPTATTPRISSGPGANAAAEARVGRFVPSVGCASQSSTSPRSRRG
jgi:hypothetical protein